MGVHLNDSDPEDAYERLCVTLDCDVPTYLGALFGWVRCGWCERCGVVA